MKQKEELLQTLLDSGLSENEARVYLSALSLGPTTVLKIARAAEIKRTTVYSVLESLQKKGLLSVEVKGLKKLYAAENPQRLKNVFKEREERLVSSLPEFESLYNLKGDGGFVKYYEGLRSVKELYSDLLKTVRPNDKYYVRSDVEEWYALDEKFFTDFNEKRARLNLKPKLILTDSPKAREQEKYARNFNTDVKILPASLDISVNLVVTPHQVIIHQLVPPISAIVIENKTVIKLHQELFENMWDSLGSKDKSST